jgi:hypothetical protein
MNATSGTRLDDTWQRVQADSGPEGPSASSSGGSAASTPTRSVADLPDAPAPHAALGKAGVCAPAITEASTAARDAQVRHSLDAFRMQASPWYHTPSGDIVAATPFIIKPGYAAQRASMADPSVAAELARAAARAGLSRDDLDRIHVGRGTPDEIHRVTQALIDGQPPGKVCTSQDVRKLMFDHMIGLDCAGYTQQAYLSATGKTAKQAGFIALVNESLSGLSGRGFARIDPLSKARPGDLLVFGVWPEVKNGVGHRAVVYDQRLATASDMQMLLSTGNGQAFAVGGPIRVVEMDSSYGSGGDPDHGGVQRQTWLYNETTGAWAHQEIKDGAPWVTRCRALYDHPLEGIYRSRGDVR